MLRINQAYIDRFKRNGKNLFYLVSPGVYLSFDGDTLDYVGVEFYFTPGLNSKINYKAEKKLVELISKGLVEYYE